MMIMNMRQEAWLRMDGPGLIPGGGGGGDFSSPIRV